MPKIGMRIIKSAVAALLVGILYCFMPDRNPFYAIIASIYSMRVDTQSSLVSLRNRTVATLVGGISGYFSLLIILHYMDSWNINFTYIFAILWVLPLLYLMVLIKVPEGAYLACVVFLSVTVTQKASETDAARFVLDRMIDTEIGAVIAVFVNTFHIPYRKNTSVFFLLSIENELEGKRGELTTSAWVPLSNLMSHGAPISLLSWMTPAGILTSTSHLTLEYPIFALGGACIYDEKDYSYLASYPLSDPSKSAFEAFCLIQKQTYFTVSVHHDILSIYYDHLEKEADQFFFDLQKSRPYQNIIHGDLPAREQTLGYFVILERENLENWDTAFEDFSEKDQFQHHTLPDFISEEYIAYLFVSSEITPQWMWEQIRKTYPAFNEFIFIPEDRTKSEREILTSIRKSYYNH